MTTLLSFGALVLTALHPPASQEHSLELGLPAPDLALASWIEPGAHGSETGKTSESSYDSGDDPGEQASGQKGERRGQVRRYHGYPLVIHTLAWNDDASTSEVLPLMCDLVYANADRGIAMIGVASDAGEDTPDRELPYPVARADLADSTSPYIDVAANGLSHAFVIGPNGALLWRGDPLKKQRDFLKAVQAAYARTVVMPLETAMHAELEKAVTGYLAGDLKDALSRSRKLSRGKDEELTSDATALAQLIQTTQADWLNEVEQHGASGPDLRYFECVRAIRTSLAKTDAIEELDALEKVVKKKKYWRLRVEDLNNWLELCDERPALFPARVSKAGKAHAKDLEKFKRSTFNSNQGTRAADALLARYERAQGE